MDSFSGLIGDVVSKTDVECSDFIEGKNFYHKILDNGVEIERYVVDSDLLANKYHRDKGKYSIITIGDLLYASKKEKDYFLSVLEEELCSYIKPSYDDSILVVGLGNENIGADSLGSRVVDRVIVSRKISDIRPSVSSIAPSVLGLTGVESADIVAGVIDKTKPNKVIVIDSLCAAKSERLFSSIQITDTAITPGGGVGNARKTIGKSGSVEHIIVIGVPLLIYLDTYLRENIDKDSIKTSIQNIVSDDILSSVSLDKILDSVFKASTKSQVVTLKEIDLEVKAISHLISTAINKVLFGVGDFGEI